MLMQYMSGGTALHLLERMADIPLPILRKMLQEVAAGLAFLHSHRIVHRCVCTV